MKTPASLSATAPAGSPINYAQAQLYRTVAQLQEARATFELLIRLDQEGADAITLHSSRTGESVTVPMPGNKTTRRLFEALLTRAELAVEALERYEIVACREVAMVGEQAEQDKGARAAYFAAETSAVPAPAAPVIPFEPRQRPTAGSRSPQQGEAATA